ncbi:MAG: hypothetical protein ACTHOJ_17680 [Sphingomonas oligoaromativorans]
METVSGQHFENTAVDLDGRRFERCTFLNADLHWTATDSIAFGEKCFFANCRIRLSGRAVLVIDFLRQMHATGLTDAVEGVLRLIRETGDDVALN